MTRSVVRWTQKVVVVIAAVFALSYGGDWILFKLRGSPFSKVTINRYVTIPLKGGKQEFDYLGSSMCLVRALCFLKPANLPAGN